MSRSRIGPAKAATTAGFRQTIILPPAAGSSGAGGSGGSGGECACADLTLGLAGQADPLAGVRYADGADALLVAAGTICPDTEWDFITTWTPVVDGAEAPTFTAAGNTAWLISGDNAGVLSIAATAICGTVTITLPTVVLTVEAREIFEGWLDLIQIADTSFGTDPMPTVDDPLQVVVTSASGTTWQFRPYAQVRLLPTQRITQLDVAVDYVPSASGASREYRQRVHANSAAGGAWEFVPLTDAVFTDAEGTVTIEDTYALSPAATADDMTVYFGIGGKVVDATYTQNVRRWRVLIEIVPEE